MAVSFDPSQAASSVRDQVQISVMRQQRGMQEMQGQQAVQLINQAGKAAQGAPQQSVTPVQGAQPSANAPHEGRNINVVV